MKKLNPTTASSLFPTKKRSFDSSWGPRATWAALLGVGIAVSSAFTAAVVFLMAPQKVRFLNVRAANLPDLRSAVFPGEVEVSQNTPLLFFGQNDVVFGTVGSVIAPRLGSGTQGGQGSESVLIVPRAKWREELSSKAKMLSGLASQAEMPTFVVGFDERLNDEADFQLARDVAGFAASLDARNQKGMVHRPPTLLFARVPSGPTSTSWKQAE